MRCVMFPLLLCGCLWDAVHATSASALEIPHGDSLLERFPCKRGRATLCTLTPGWNAGGDGLKLRLFKSRVSELLQERGFVPSKHGFPSACHLTWVQVGLPDVPTSDFPLKLYAELGSIYGFQQKVNRLPHFSTAVNQKDAFARAVAAAAMRHPEEFDFHPETFAVADAAERDALMAAATASGTSERWIAKPIFGGRGEGIRLLSAADLDTVPRDGDWLVQRYIPNPLLVDGYKFTMRLYVAVTSVVPLRVYLYEDGIIKMASSRFSAGMEDHTTDKKLMHVTNQAANSKTAAFQYSDDPSVANIGFRRDLSAFREHCEGAGIDADALFSRIESTVVKGLIAAEPTLADRQHLPHRGSGFQLLGVDVDIDADLKPWLIEANVNPTLHASIPFDVAQKDALLTDLFNLAGVSAQFNGTEARAFVAAQISASLSHFRASDGGGGLHDDEAVDDVAVDDVAADDDLAAWALLDSATPEDVADLAALEFELANRGSFKMLFPCERYLHLFEQSKRENLIAVAWLRTRSLL